MAYIHTESPLYELLLKGRKQHLPKGQIVHLFEDRTVLHLIKTGYIKRYLIKSDGSRSIQVIYGPDDIVPLTPVYITAFDMRIYSGPELYYYEAMTDVELYSLRHDLIQEALDKNPIIYKDLFYAAGTRLNSYIHRLEDTSIVGSHRRVAHLLTYFADVFGEKTEAGTTILLPLTHQVIAEALNVTRETATISVNNLRKKGLITGSKIIVVPDLDKLRSEALS